MNNKDKILTMEEIKDLKKFSISYSSALQKEYLQLQTGFNLFKGKVLDIDSQSALEIREGLSLYAKGVNDLEQRGLWRRTKFCLFDALGITGKEEIHSNLLFWLLNPDESHGLGDKFLKELIKTVFNCEIDVNKIESRKLEKDLTEGRRIDIEIIGHEWILAIENKINSSELNDQTSRYAKYYKNVEISKGISKDRLFLIYLTRTGEAASSDYFKSVSYKQIRMILEKIKPEFNEEANYLLTYFIQHIFYNLEN